MSRIRAFLLFGGFALMIAGYVAWCSRTFWVVVDFPDLSQIPENQRAGAETEIKAAGLTKPDPFSWEVMLKLLMKPYDTASRPVGVSVHVHREYTDFPTGYHLYIYRTRRNARSNEQPVILFGRENGEWVVYLNPGTGVKPLAKE